MLGKYIPYNDGYGIIGFSYECPICKFITPFRNCEEGCERCNFSEDYVDQDDWYEEEMKKSDMNIEITEDQFNSLILKK